MSTVVGIFMFISKINTTSESFKASKIFNFQHFMFIEQFSSNFILSWVEPDILYNLRPDFPLMEL